MDNDQHTTQLQDSRFHARSERDFLGSLIVRSDGIEPVVWSDVSSALSRCRATPVCQRFLR